MGDAGKPTEAAMLAAGLVVQAQVLKVGHHGSSSASSLSFLNAVKPEVAIYMAKTGNSYGHPHQVTIDALNQVGAAIYGTDMLGTIVVTTNGQSRSIQPTSPSTTPPLPASAIPPTATQKPTYNVEGYPSFTFPYVLQPLRNRLLLQVARTPIPSMLSRARQLQNPTPVFVRSQS